MESHRGLFGYVLSATLASTGIDFSVQHFGWDVTFMVILACVLLAIAFMFSVGRDEKAMRARKVSAQQK